VAEGRSRRWWRRLATGSGPPSTAGPGSDAAPSATGAGGAGTNVQGPAITMTEFRNSDGERPRMDSRGPRRKDLVHAPEHPPPAPIGSLTTMGTMFNLYATASTRTGPTGIVGGPDGKRLVRQAIRNVAASRRQA